MATRDISKTGYSRAKRYADLHAQMGRLFTDADQIEQAETRAEAARLATLDIVGPYGSPDEGFRVSNLNVNGGQIDFDIAPGVLYLGGHRLERLRPETFQLQTDWLNNPGVAPPPAGQVRRDLVLIETWLQPVAATEDAETLEPGLAGPDTSVRIRQMTRVRLVSGVNGATCEDAWSEVRNAFPGMGLGTLDAAHELIPDTRFTIVPLPGSGGGDLCSPGTGAGYLDAENQAIRIAITDAGEFIWGFNNAEPLYRVVLEDGGATVRFLTEPRDALRWPAQNMTVELLPWGAVLENGEKIADESRPGHFAQVESGYNPDTRRLTLTAATAVPGTFGTEWQGRADNAQLTRTRYGQSDAQEAFHFLRVWDRGTDTTPGPTLPLPAAPANAPLGDTGLAVRVDGADRRPGDFAIAAARPATPDIVMPWSLLAGVAPLGIRRFVAPLAVLEWNGNAGTILSDCRPPFRPLTELRGCCTYTVGDDNISFGDFSSIQDAVNALPDSGGQVCILPGIYRQRVQMLNLTNVRLTGCGRRSRLIDPDDGGGPIIDVLGGRAIDIDDLTFETPTAIAIRARGRIDKRRSRPLIGLRLRRLDLEVRDRAAIMVRGVDELEISACRIALDPLTGDLGAVAPAGTEPAIFALGDDMVIADNQIRGRATRAVVRPAGGVHIGGGSDRVTIRDNRIEGGNGNGITLGHLVVLQTAVAERARDDYALVATAPVAYPGGWITIGDDGCIDWTPPGLDGGGDDGAPPTRNVSGGDVSSVVIRDNLILRMGLSGIASALAFDPRSGRPVVIRIRDLLVQRNTIRGCATLETPVLPIPQQIFVAFGGITLVFAELASFTGNTIEANGRSHIEAICGLSVIRGEALTITDNRIVDNGPRTADQSPPRPGLRAGIRVGLVAPQTVPLTGTKGLRAVSRIDPQFRGARALSTPSLTIQGNTVQQPLGKALQVMGHGAMSITDNHLASQGTTTGSLLTLLQEIFNAGEVSDLDGQTLIYFVIERLLGTAATVLNTGYSSEMITGLSLIGLFRNTGKPVSPVGASHTASRVPLDGWAQDARLLQNGEVLFNDNTVVQNFLDGAPSLTLCSVFAMSLDDVSVQDNSLTSQMDFAGDFSMMNLMTLAWSVRACGNRMEETLLRSLNSALTAGFFNDTSHNQATHCIDAIGMPALLIDGPNRILAAAIDPLICGGCLLPPFNGLQIVDLQGQQIPRQVSSLDGHDGLNVTGGALITFNIPVSRVDLTIYGLSGDDGFVEVIARNGNTTIDTQVRYMGQAPVDVRLTGAGIRTVTISPVGVKTMVLTGLCTNRPGLGGGGGGGSIDVKGATFMAWNGG